MVERQSVAELFEIFSKTFAGFRKRLFLCIRFKRKAAKKTKSRAEKRNEKCLKTFGSLKTSLTFAAANKKSKTFKRAVKTGEKKKTKIVLKTFGS